LEAVLLLDNSVDTPAPSRSPAPAPPFGLVPEIEHPPADNESQIPIAEGTRIDRPFVQSPPAPIESESPPTEDETPAFIAEGTKMDKPVAQIAPAATESGVIKEYPDPSQALPRLFEASRHAVRCVQMAIKVMKCLMFAWHSLV
jgi:hypothetical protein